MTDPNPNGSPAGPPADFGQQGYPPPPPPPAGYGQPVENPYGPPDQGQYAPSAYPQQPAYGAPYGYAPKTNTLAIFSLIASIVNFIFIPVIGSIVAVITGHMALKQVRTSGEAGRGMALAGTIVGWVGIGLFALGLVIVIILLATIGAASSSYTYS